MISALVCLFALCVGAQGFESNGYGELTVIEGQTEPTVIDADAKIVLLGNDGLYYTFPSYYVLEDQALFRWKSNAEVTSILGYSQKGANNDFRLNVVRMEIPEGITQINPGSEGGAFAFEDAKKLVEVTIPSTMAYLGNYAFNRCYALVTMNGFTDYIGRTTKIGTLLLNGTLWGEGVDLVIPEGFVTLPEGCFHGTKISSVTLPSTIETISKHSFAGCSNLTSIDVSKCTKIKTIGDYALEKTKLTTFDFTPFASTLESLGEGIFIECGKLTTVTGFEKATKLTEIKTKMFYLCPLTEINIPEGIVTIGGGAFRGHMSTQTEFRLPNTVESIGDHAFTRGSRGGPTNLKIYLSANLKTLSPAYTFENWYYGEMYLSSSIVEITTGFCNNTLQKGVVYYYTGDLNTLTIATTNNAAMTNATWISAEEFTGASQDCNYIVYNYSECLAFYDGHSCEGYSLGDNVNYLSKIDINSTCTRCKEAVLYTQVSPIMVDLGYSYCEFTPSMTHAYAINKTAFAELKSFFPEVKLGFVATVNTGDTAIDPMQNASVISHEFKSEEELFIAFNVKVVGLNDNLLDTRVIFCAYINDGESLKYLDDKTSSDTVKGKTFNEVVAENTAE